MMGQAPCVFSEIVVLIGTVFLIKKASSITSFFRGNNGGSQLCDRIKKVRASQPPQKSWEAIALDSHSKLVLLLKQ